MQYVLVPVSYIAEEAGITFDFPFTLEMDNQAAIIFCDGTASKTRLKHIDTRQEWIRMLRNKNLVIARHVPTEENLADLFTKILPRPTFVKLRDQVLKTRPTQDRSKYRYAYVRFVHAEMKRSAGIRRPLHNALVEEAKTNM